MSTSEDHSHPSGAVQQAPGLWRTELQQQDLSVPGREVVQQRVDIGPEAPAVKHTHPGELATYVVETASRSSRWPSDPCPPVPPSFARPAQWKG